MKHWTIAAGCLLAAVGHFIVASDSGGLGPLYLRLSGALMFIAAAVAVFGRGRPWMRAAVVVFAMVAATSVWRLVGFPWASNTAAFLLHHVGIFVLGGALAVAWFRPSKWAPIASQTGAALAGLGALWSGFGGTSNIAIGASIEGVGFLLLAVWPFKVRDVASP